jgi:heme-degrading monooxygenase HmoA
MIVSLTIVRYRKALIPLALLAMALHRLPLMLNKGCTFYKLVGCGRNGSFDLTPDWQQWGLLAVWNNRDDFDSFYQQSFVSKWWKRLTTESWTMLAEPLQSHGKWDGQEPFGKNQVKDYGGPVAVLTRATIRTNRLKNFWSHVDQAAKMMASSKGYITSVGIGEAPVYRQATFSVWESLNDVKAFAYRSPEHAEVIKKTRDENWYSEELFARFRPVAAWGTLHGADPLKGKIIFKQE